MARPLSLPLALAAALALTACKSKAERDSERAMPAVEAIVARVPAAEPKAFVRTAIGYADQIAALEEAVKNGPHPPPGTPASAKLAPVRQWITDARAEVTALEAAFQEELTAVEPIAHAELGRAVLGADTKRAEDMAAVMATTKVQPLVLWHGAGSRRGFDEDHQNLPPERRALNPGARFVVGYVQRVDGEGVTFVVEHVVAERKVAFVALYEMPSKRRMGVFKVIGETARLPKPVPMPGTTLPGEKPPVIENLLRAPAP